MGIFGVLLSFNSISSLRLKASTGLKKSSVICSREKVVSVVCGELMVRGSEFVLAISI